jgi:hypothetical protein
LAAPDRSLSGPGRPDPLDALDRIGRIDLVDLSEVARACVDGLRPGGHGPYVSLELDLATELPFVLADPSVLCELATRLVRRAAEVIDEDWGVVTVATGILGLGRAPLAREEALAGLVSHHHVYLEVHGTGPALGPLSSGHAEDPFAARGLGPLDSEKAAALLGALDGVLLVDPIATAGVSVLLMLPYAGADLPV